MSCDGRTSCRGETSCRGLAESRVGSAPFPNIAPYPQTPQERPRPAGDRRHEYGNATTESTPRSPGASEQHDECQNPQQDQRDHTGPHCGNHVCPAARRRVRRPGKVLGGAARSSRMGSHSDNPDLTAQRTTPETEPVKLVTSASFRDHSRFSARAKSHLGAPHPTTRQRQRALNPQRHPDPACRAASPPERSSVHPILRIRSTGVMD